MGPVPRLVKILREALLGKDADPRAYQIVGEAFRLADRKGMSTAIRSLSLNRSDLAPLRRRITAPTLLIPGESEIMATVAEAQKAGDLPNGTAVSVPGSGHITPLLQNAPAVAELMIGFWAGTDKG